MTNETNLLDQPDEVLLFEVPTHELCRGLREELFLTATQLGDLIGVDKQTIWRWERDPEDFPDSARQMPMIARRILVWMVRDGRPPEWPLPPITKRRGD